MIKNIVADNCTIRVGINNNRVESIIFTIDEENARKRDKEIEVLIKKGIFDKQEKKYQKEVMRINADYLLLSLKNSFYDDTPELQALKNIAEEFINRIKQTKKMCSLILTGSAGTGKTSTAFCIAHRLVHTTKRENPYSYLFPDDLENKYEYFNFHYLTYKEFLEQIRESKNFNSKKNYLEYIKSLSNYDLLILDEYDKAEEQDKGKELFQLLEYMHNQNKSIIIISNSSYVDVNMSLKGYGISRLNTIGNMFKFDTTGIRDYRQKPFDNSLLN